MDYLHLIRDEDTKRSVQRVAQNDPMPREIYAFYNNDLELFDNNALLALGHALRGNTNLHCLRLRNIRLTEEAAHALTEGIAQSKLEILELGVGIYQEEDSSEELSSQGRICDIFYRGIQVSSRIQTLDLQQSLTNDPGGAWRDTLLGLTKIKIMFSGGHGYTQAFSDVLSTATLLIDLTVSFGNHDFEDMTILAHGLRQNTSVIRFQIVGRFINIQNVYHLFAPGLNPNSSITQLSACLCKVDDGCIALLTERWLPNCRMEQLDLSCNYIGPTGAQHLLQAMANHPTMVKLYLRRNLGIGYEGLRLIGDQLQNLHHLTTLNLVNCARLDANLKAESDEDRAQTRTQQQAEQALLEGIKRNLSITTLDVYSNGFSQKTMAEIELYTTLNSKGRYLLAAEGDHNVAPSVWCHVFAKCQREPNFFASLVYFYLKELPTLVQSRPLLKRKRS